MMAAARALSGHRRRSRARVAADPTAVHADHARRSGRTRSRSRTHGCPRERTSAARQSAARSSSRCRASRAATRGPSRYTRPDDGETVTVSVRVPTAMRPTTRASPTRAARGHGGAVGRAPGRKCRACASGCPQTPQMPVGASTNECQRVRVTAAPVGAHAARGADHARDASGPPPSPLGACRRSPSRRTRRRRTLERCRRALDRTRTESSRRLRLG